MVGGRRFGLAVEFIGRVRTLGSRPMSLQTRFASPFKGIARVLPLKFLLTSCASRRESNRSESASLLRRPPPPVLRRLFCRKSGGRTRNKPLKFFAKCCPQSAAGHAADDEKAAETKCRWWDSNPRPKTSALNWRLRPLGHID